MVTIIEQGLIYGILALGVYITYKILDFPDLTVDGSFPLGAAVTAALIVKGVNPYVTLPIAFLAGALAGTLTGVIHVKGKVKDLLSGIIMMTALWTVNLRIAGTSNVPIFSKESIFKNAVLGAVVPKALTPYVTVLLILLVTCVCKIALDFYLNTKSGFLLRATGENEKVVTALGKEGGTIKILGLALANGLSALAGSLFCQEERVFEISMGTGAIVIGLASVIMGMSLFSGSSSILFLPIKVKATTAVLTGAIFYKAIVAVALRFFEPQDMKLITAVLFFMILTMGRKKKEGSRYAAAQTHS